MTNTLPDHEPGPAQSEVFRNPIGEILALRFEVVDLAQHYIGQNWQEQVSQAITEEGELNLRVAGGHETVREADSEGLFGLHTIEGEVLAQRVPGIWAMYQGPFKRRMQVALPHGSEALRSYKEPELGLEGISQIPATEPSDVNFRYEAHTDQRYTAVWVVDAPPEDSEKGRLVIANNPNAQTADQIAEDAVYIAHRIGTLVCFSQGGKYPHFTEEITVPDLRRITVALNYPHASETPEQAAELLKHIRGV